MNQRRAFVMIYAVGTLVLVTSLALTMMEAGGADTQIAKQRLYQVLARDAAESGIEYAMAFVTRQLGRDFDGQGDGGPWKDPNYMFDPQTPPVPGSLTQPWFYAARAANRCAAWPSLRMVPYNNSWESQSEGPPIRLHEMLADGTDGRAVVASPNTPKAQITQFQISMIPEMTYQNVRMATDSGAPTVFYVRSRGELLYNEVPGNPVVLASAYLIQSFMVVAPDGCPMPRPIRQVLDREAQNLTRGVWMGGPKRGTVDLSTRYFQAFQAPNPH